MMSDETAFNAIYCLHECSLQTLAVGTSKVEVMILYIQYSKHNVHGLIHDRDNFFII